MGISHKSWVDRHYNIACTHWHHERLRLLTLKEHWHVSTETVVWPLSREPQCQYGPIIAFENLRKIGDFGFFLDFWSFWSNLFETFFLKLCLHKIEKCSPPRAAVNLLSNFWSDRSKQPFSDILQEFSFWYLAALDLPCFNLNPISSEKLQYFYSSHICVFLIFYQTKCQLYKAQMACLPETIIIINCSIQELSWIHGFSIIFLQYYIDWNIGCVLTSIFAPMPLFRSTLRQSLSWHPILPPHLS